MLNIGINAPDFTLIDQDGNQISLSDFRGKRVILYFYPKDDTTACTKQACSYAEQYPLFLEKNSIVIGISKDTKASHKRFAEKFQLPFHLLADPELEAIQLYDVWHEKSMYGKKFMGIVRSSYLIDEDGIIIHAESKVKATENAGQMLKLL